jgi:hypothetical protein
MDAEKITNFMDVMAEKLICQKCSVNPANEDEHFCPWLQDIHDDTTTLCNCCPECTKECERDV